VDHDRGGLAVSNLDVFGPLIDATVVERVVIDTLKGSDGWLSTYLAEVEDRAPGFEKGQLHRPRTWQADIDVRKFPEGQLPAVVCVVGQGDPDSDGENVNVRWPLAVGVIVKAPSRQRSRDLARMYAAAVLGAILHKLPGREPITDVVFEGVAFREVRGNTDVVAAAAEVAFTVLVPAVVALYGGPAQPDPEPIPPGNPPGDDGWPEYPEAPTVSDEDFHPDITATPVALDEELPE
jgi:hypothetical protein